MYQPKLPVTGVSFFLLGLSPLYNFSITMLFIITISIILFRLIRLFVKEGKIKKLLGIILIIFVSLISIYSFGNYKSSLKLQKSEDILLNYNIELENNINSPIITPLNNDDNTTLNKYYPNSGEVLGKISIPKISLELPIIEDATDENLWLGAAHIRGTPLPNEKGNSFIASHNLRNYGKLFNRLHELELGDKLTLNLDNNSFTYEVYNISIVEPNDEECFKEQNGDYNLSLVTCTSNGTKRLIVSFKRV